MSRTRQVPSEAASSSQIQSTEEHPNNPSAVLVSATLRLRAGDGPAASTFNQDESTSRHIRWSEDVIDNEGMGKKSSKVCCIYHKNRSIGDSSSESESSDSSAPDSDTDSDSESGYHRRSGQRRPSNQNDNHITCDQRASPGGERPAHRHAKKAKRKPSPNAYEKMPKTAKGR
ncbi:type 1 phosphatases regulator ypi1 [Aspergillus sclerotioniger CBS 115572]|uniref:Type 1 phosphatases regulator n=1 Tax=Aspergillus sclerotioniger CBS 115572 TaxID=1450535 RepID=A0A317UWU0_9EURO|nr:type 1 phosphatases regulator ypi1 [Aspergillus sclerotioniger CBS 115572]PWY66155.1 type 1 phosphatases regulator ypi1 [Aspergillus sclerotioniger CBS 115572]